MPDPLLTTLRLEKEIERVAQIAERFKASLARQGNFVFLEMKDANSREMLARLDCDGYPEKPINAEFLDPQTVDRVGASASNNHNHWPSQPGPLQKDGKLYLCLAGIKSYLAFHVDPGYVMTLSDLVKSLILWCRGQSHLLRKEALKGTPIRRIP